MMVVDSSEFEFGKFKNRPSGEGAHTFSRMGNTFITSFLFVFLIGACTVSGNAFGLPPGYQCLLASGALCRVPLTPLSKTSDGGPRSGPKLGQLSDFASPASLATILSLVHIRDYAAKLAPSTEGSAVAKVDYVSSALE